MSKSPAKFARSAAMEFANLCQFGTLQEITAACETISTTNEGKAWRRDFSKLLAWLKGGNPAFQFFNLQGNKKLPFAAWSVLPIVTCPGKGDCANYCYSLRAWRYSGAYARQCQNTIAMRFFRRQIIDAFKALPEGVTLRLFVDGDFDSAQTVLFWFNMLNNRSDVLAYGYSKSWEELLAVPEGVWPKNYVLNVSSGSKHGESLRDEVKRITQARGEFIAVPVSGNFPRGSARYGSAEYHRAVRESALNLGYGKVFSCPGICGTCTGKGHACGMVELSLPIAIGVH